MVCRRESVHSEKRTDVLIGTGVKEIRGFEPNKTEALWQNGPLY